MQKKGDLFILNLFYKFQHYFINTDIVQVKTAKKYHNKLLDIIISKLQRLDK